MQLAMDVHELIEQLQGCSAFFASLRELTSEAAVLESHKAMSTSLQCQIQNLSRLDAANAAKLNAAITASAFHSDAKQALAAAVTSKTMGAMASAQANHGGPRRCQTISTLEAYLTEQEWQALQDTQRTTAQKVQVLVDRVILLGLKNPSEATVRHIVAVLASAHCPDAPPDTLHSMVLDVKVAIHARAHYCPTSHHLTTFPQDPKDLPTDLHAIAFATAQPAGNSIEGLATISARVPLRSTNKTLNYSTSALGQNQHRNPKSPCATAGANAVQLLLQQLMVAAQSAGQAEVRLPGLQVFTTPKQASASALLTLPSPEQSNQPSRPALSPPGLALPGLAQQGVQALTSGESSLLEASVAAAPPKQESTEDTQPQEDVDGDDIVEKLEKVAAGKVNEKLMPKQKGKTCAKAQPMPALSERMMKRPSMGVHHTHLKAKPSASLNGRLLLGCSKCRGSHVGCITCRNPAYGGTRWQK